MPAAPKLYSHFLKMLQPVEGEFEDVKHLKGKFSVEKSLNSLGEFDHAPLFESIQEIFSYALACIASNTPECVPPNARASHEGVSDGEDGGTGGAGGAQGFRSEGSDSSKWIDPNAISKTVQEVNTKSVDHKGSFPIWRDFHPERGFFREVFS